MTVVGVGQCSIVRCESVKTNIVCSLLLSYSYWFYTGVLVSVVTVRIHSSWGEAIIYLLILLPVIRLNLFIDLCAIYLSLMWEQWKHSACRLQNDSGICRNIFFYLQTEIYAENAIIWFAKLPIYKWISEAKRKEAK